jgi:hypothetical protein
MDYNNSLEILTELKAIRQIELEQLEYLKKILVVFSKYDEEFQQSPDYLKEISADGMNPPRG